MVEPVRAEVLLGQLRDLDVRLSVDDFGTGYSSLSYLKRLPVCEVKIDQGFVRSLSSTGEDNAIVHSVVDVGQHLGLDVVAEGIEDEATWLRLQKMGCAQGQGFLLTRPMPVPDFAVWYARLTLRPVPALPCAGHAGRQRPCRHKGRRHRPRA